MNLPDNHPASFDFPPVILTQLIFMRSIAEPNSFTHDATLEWSGGRAGSETGSGELFLLNIDVEPAESVTLTIPAFAAGVTLADGSAADVPFRCILDNDGEVFHDETIDVPISGGNATVSFSFDDDHPQEGSRWMIYALKWPYVLKMGLPPSCYLKARWKEQFTIAATPGALSGYRNMEFLRSGNPCFLPNMLKADDVDTMAENDNTIDVFVSGDNGLTGDDIQAGANVFLAWLNQDAVQVSGQPF